MVVLVSARISRLRINGREREYCASRMVRMKCIATRSLGKS